MAQQTFSGVPGDFTAGQVLTAADMDLLREFLLYLIKDGDETDTGEVSPLILDLGSDIVNIVGQLVVGVDDTGHDVKFFGASTGKYAFWDESEDTLEVQGQILIGNTTGTKSLTVDGEADAEEAIRLVNPTGGPGSDPGSVFIGFKGYGGGTADTYPGSKIGSEEFDGADRREHLVFYTKGTNDTGTAPLKRMQIRSNGKIGVNCEDPPQQFCVSNDGSELTATTSTAHNIIAFSAGDCGMGVYSGNTSNGYFRFADTDSQSSGGFNYDHNTNMLDIRANGSDMMRLAGPTRYVTMGYASAFPGTDGMLNIQGNDTTRGIQMYQDTTGTTAINYHGQSDVGGTQTTIAKIESNGDFQSATDSYGPTTSDERLKTTEACRDYLDDLLALDVVNFQFTKRFVPTQVPKLDGNGNPTFEQVPVLDGDGNPTYTQIEYLDDEGNTAYTDGEQVFTDGEALTQDHPTEGEIVDRDPADYSHKQLGLIAQQVEPHIPGLVKTDDYGIKTLRTSVLVPMLLQAVQTLTARIEALEA